MKNETIESANSKVINAIKQEVEAGNYDITVNLTK